MKVSPRSKLILGTVQFGLEYGINNQQGKISPAEVFQVLRLANGNNIKFLDCASHYGNSSELIGDFHIKEKQHFDCYSKIILDDKNSERELIWKEARKLNCQSLEGVYLHRFSDLEKCDWQVIESCKADGLIKKFGVSIYTLEELTRVLDNLNINLIQIPYNLLDCSDEKEKLIQEATKQGKSIIVRSVFLQGLFFKDLNSFPFYLRELRPLISHINNFFEKENINPLGAHFYHAAINNSIDGVILGVDSPQHLLENIQVLNNELSSDYFFNKISLLKDQIKFLKNKINGKKYSLLINPSVWGIGIQSFDLQWPDARVTDNFFYVSKNGEYQTREDLISQVENYFSEKYDCPAILTPSGKSGIASLLRFLGFNKSKNIHVPPWSSNCLYSAIAMYSAPTSLWSDYNIDLSIVVHKWGHRYSLKDYLGVIVEDSVDRIPKDKKDLFYNNGIMEILSMPKILGSWGGGIVLTRDRNLLDWFKKEQSDLGYIGQTRKDFYANKQSDLKRKNYYEGITYWDYWGHFEVYNTYVDKKLVKDIAEKLSNLEINQKIIEQRFEKINLVFSKVKKTFGPVAVIPTTYFPKYKLAEMKSYFMVKNFSFCDDVKKLSFEEVVVFPWHFSIDDEEFDFRLKQLKDYL